MRVRREPPRLRWRRVDLGLPLSVLAAGTGLAGSAAAVAAAAAAEWVHHGFDAWSLGAGGIAAGGTALAFGFAAHRFARGLRMLRGESLRRLHDPAAPASGGPALSLRTSNEVAELSRTLEALHLRIRVADDVAERHRRTAENASAGMFELLSGLAAAEEGARGQLAADLHDSAAQTLMLARSRLRDALESGEPPRLTLVAVAELLDEAEEQVRAVMARTRPPGLRDGDLARAVSGLRDDLAVRYGLVVRISWPSEPHPLPLVTAITVYRFFQEALLNVVKHADVDEAVASLTVDDNGVTAVVFDDGPGFDPERTSTEGGRHVGLGLLRERARLAGGSLEVTSWPHRGTTLTLRLPAGPVVATAAPLPRAVGAS